MGDQPFRLVLLSEAEMRPQPSSVTQTPAADAQHLLMQAASCDTVPSCLLCLERQSTAAATATSIPANPERQSSQGSKGRCEVHATLLTRSADTGT